MYLNVKTPFLAGTIPHFSARTRTWDGQHNAKKLPLAGPLLERFPTIGTTVIDLTSEEDSGTEPPAKRARIPWNFGAPTKMVETTIPIPSDATIIISDSTFFAVYRFKNHDLVPLKDQERMTNQ